MTREELVLKAVRCELSQDEFDEADLARCVLDLRLDDNDTEELLRALSRMASAHGAPALSSEFMQRSREFVQMVVWS